MKLLFVCQHYAPERIDISPYCEALSAAGHDVTALVGLPNYHMPGNRIPKRYKQKSQRVKNINGVKVIRCTEIGRRNNVLFLFLNYVSFYLSSLNKVRKLDNDFDCVVCFQYSPITMASAAVKYAKKHHCPLILYCFDLWPESIKVYNINEKSILFRIVRKISSRIYQACDKILVTSQPFVEYFKTVHNISNKKISYLPQYTRDYKKDLKQKKTDKKIHLLYAGNLGKMQGVEYIIDAAAKINTKKDFVIDIVGAGSDAKNLKKKVEERHLEKKVVFHGEKSGESLNEFYSMADALLLTMKDNGSYISKTLPLKFQSYASTGKPILACANTTVQYEMDKINCGFYTHSGNTEQYAIIIQHFIEKRPTISYKIDKRFYFEDNLNFLLKVIKETL